MHEVYDVQKDVKQIEEFTAIQHNNSQISALLHMEIGSIFV